MDAPDSLRAKEIEALEAVQSLNQHGEIIRLVLAEVSLIADKYRYVQRHDAPHIRELVGLLDLLWQEVEIASQPSVSVSDHFTGREAAAVQTGRIKRAPYNKCTENEEGQPGQKIPPPLSTTSI